MFKGRLHRLVRAEAGSEIIEFAGASFLFFTVIFGMIEFGLAVWQYNMMSNLAQEGARWAIVRGSTATGMTGSEQGSQTNLANFIQGRKAGVPVTLDTANSSTPSSLNPGDTVTVVVSSTFTPLPGIIPHATLTLQGTAKMIMSR